MPAITACNNQSVSLYGVSVSQNPALAGTTLCSGEVGKQYLPGIQSLTHPKIEEVRISYSVVRSAQTGLLDFHYTLAATPPNTNKPGVFAVSWDLCPNIKITYADFRTDLGLYSPAGSFVYGPGVNQFRFFFGDGLPAASGSFFVSTNATNFVTKAGTVTSFRNTPKGIATGSLLFADYGPTLILPSPIVAKDPNQGRGMVTQ